MADRFNIQSQMEHLQMKFVGTGHADSSKEEWLTQQHKDSYASYIGHPAMLAYFATAQNQSLGRVRYQMLQRMCKPCQEVQPQAPAAGAAAAAPANGTQ